MATLELFFDCGSPWTYLAFAGIQPIAERHGVSVIWKPILVGGVFNAVNKEVYENRAKPNPLRWAYMLKDLQDWARAYGLEIGWPPVFPVNSVKAMRGAFAAEDAGLLLPYCTAVFETYWGRLEDISQDEVLARVVAGLGMDPAAFLAAIASPECKDRLRANTDELVARGGFGSPTIFVNGTDIYFGNDRLALVDRALGEAARA
jgi:2-hydroxychromene-2-carboxylate isomerase